MAYRIIPDARFFDCDRILSGRDVGAWWHPHFIRGRHDDIKLVVRTHIKSKSEANTNAPSFYDAASSSRRDDNHADKSTSFGTNPLTLDGQDILLMMIRLQTCLEKRRFLLLNLNYYDKAMSLSTYRLYPTKSLIKYRHPFHN